MGRIRARIYHAGGIVLISILDRKGFVTKDEILKEVEVVKKEMDEEIRRMGREN